MAGWALTFEGVDPTIFNFVADLLAVAFRAIFALGVGHAFVYLMSHHLGKGRSIPTLALGQVPSDFISSCRYAYMLKMSGPVLLLALLLALGDFSHSIADLGLSFVTVSMKGPRETVLALDRRNPSRLFELSGDPMTLRTLSYPDSSYNDDLMQYRRENGLIQNFLIAIDDIAGGGSPLANFTEVDSIEHNYHGAEAVAYIGGGKALSQIKLKIPLDCPTGSMASIPQSINGGPERIPLKNTALVPDCNFKMLRPSGIYEGSKGSAEIFEYMFTDLQQENVILDRSENFTSLDRALARDRNDWKQGRLVTSVKGIRIGDLNIQFNSSMLATGSFDQQVRAIGTQIIYVQTRFYVLASNVIGACPPLPSGLLPDGVTCLVFSLLDCNPAFQEDLEPFLVKDFKDQKAAEERVFLPPRTESNCKLLNANIVWGRNFLPDEEFMAVVSAVLSRAQLNPYKAFQFRTAIRNCAPAALFALSTTSEAPAIQSQVSLQINIVFIFFLLLPLSVTATIFIATYKGSKLPIPSEGWQLMVLGREEATVPTRRDNEMEFPEEASKHYEYAIRKDASGRPLSVREGLGIHPIEPKTYATTNQALQQGIPSDHNSNNNRDEYSSDHVGGNNFGLDWNPDEQGVSVMTGERPRRK